MIAKHAFPVSITWENQTIRGTSGGNQTTEEEETHTSLDQILPDFTMNKEMTLQYQTYLNTNSLSLATDGSSKTKSPHMI